MKQTITTIPAGGNQDDHAGKGRTEAYQLRDVHRRIRNILDVYPATSWDLSESQAVLAALAGIVRGRQAVGDVIDFRTR
jgi:hypothetical protein